MDDLPLKLPSLEINSKVIKRVTSAKFLGIKINEHLNWDDHIKTVENKVAKNIGLLYKAKPFLSKQCLNSLYFSFINCYINYPNIVWGNCYKSKLKKLNAQMKHASRIIMEKDKLTHARPLMRELKILNVYQLNIYQTICFMFKVKNNNIPEAFKNKFTIT